MDEWRLVRFDIKLTFCQYTETKMLSFWLNFHHWLRWNLSKRQLPVQAVVKISSKRYFHFSDMRIPVVEKGPWYGSLFSTKASVSRFAHWNKYFWTTWSLKQISFHYHSNLLKFWLMFPSPQKYVRTSTCRHFLQLLQLKLSQWNFPVQSVTKISSSDNISVSM